MWLKPWAVLAWVCMLNQQMVTFAADATGVDQNASHTETRASLSAFVTSGNASSADIEAARLMIKDAITKMTKLNKARVGNPSRNNYKLKPGTQISKRHAELAPPLLTITNDLARAAALLAELDAKHLPINHSSPLEKRGGSFWLGNLHHKGSVPWGKDSSYKVFRNVQDYGADPTGARDSTKAIQLAIDDGKRCGAGCNGATNKNAMVYFPPGRYLVSSSIAVYFGTQMIGDALQPPTIVAARSFVGLGVLSTDVYVDNGGTGPNGNSLEWYINTARFYSQIRNFKIDITATSAGAYVAALHYQVAQATTLEHVEFIADSSTTQQGIFAENGSGGVMSDLTFSGGNFGIYGGSQQFSAARLTFNGCNTAVQLIWDWGWVWKSITVNNVKVGFRLYNDANGQIPGSATFVDSLFSNIHESAIEMAVPVDRRDSGFTGLVLDNVRLGGQIKDHWSMNQILKAGYYKNYVMGVTYKDGKRTWTMGPMDYIREPSLLGAPVPGLDVAPYYERPRNQYTDKSAADFIHLRDQGAKGDGSTDDTAAVQDAFNKYGDGSKIIYVDAGTYILKDTVTIPNGARIVGETWSQFAANGDKFSDAKKPAAMLKVGNAGNVGTVEMQDLILTSKGPTPGVILMEWNIQAKDKGNAALWDVHIRLGGAVGTELTPAECPPNTRETNSPNCQVASLLLHVTKQASGYFENIWAWVADHQIDDPDLNDIHNNMEQLSVYSARGILIESRKATWLYGTASEHSVYYQYNFHGARNIFTTFLQTESAYYQPTPAPPAPFESAVGVFDGDPGYSCKGGDADGCDASWGVIMKNCQNVHVSAAGTYSWFTTYTQECVDTRSCQKALWLIDDNYDNNRLQQIISIGAKNMVVSSNGTTVTSESNLAVTSHPGWAHISLLEVPSIEPPPEKHCPASDYWYYQGDWTPGRIDGLIGLSHLGTQLTNGRNSSEYVIAYVTIVNLTPYKFVHTGGPEPYQFKKWDFADIPSGKSRENEADYDQMVGDFTTTNGYANYQIEGTNKTFVVHVTTNMDDARYQERVWFDLRGMGMGAREYAFPGDKVPATLIITGSEDYGYISSLQFQNYAWMRSLYDVIKDRQLRHVVVPGSHDAAMNEITDGGWWNGGSAPNTETQSLDLYNQLRVGVRYFDMRIASVENGTFYGAHVNDDIGSHPSGATGPPLDDLITGMNRFTNDYPGEVVVWYITYMVDLSYTTDRYWDEAKTNEFYDKLQAINNRCPANMLNDTSFDKLPIKTFLDANEGKGCVLLLTDGRRDPGHEDIPQGRPESSIYHAKDYFSRTDDWAQKNAAGVNAEKEVKDLAKVNRTDEANNYYIMQWQCTPDLGGNLQTIAVLESNPSLYHYGVNFISPTQFPTVILHDAVGVFRLDEITEQYYDPTMQTLAIGLNLYMVSQNCHVSSSQNPLAKKRFGASRLEDTLKSKFDVFKGVVFANGTTLDQIPPNFSI